MSLNHLLIHTNDKKRHDLELLNALAGTVQVIGRHVKCPVCGSESLKKMGTFYGLDFVECPECTHFFCAAILHPNTFNALYGATPDRPQLANPVPTEEVFFNRVNGTSKDRVVFATDLIGGPGGLLVDIGSGLGDTVYSTRQQGWEVLGVEPGAKMEFYRRFDLPVKPLFSMSFPLCGQS